MTRFFPVSFLLLLVFGPAVCLKSGFAVSPTQAIVQNGKSISGPAGKKPQDRKVKPEETDALILPGKSVGSIYLGDPEWKFYLLFPPNMDFRPTYNPDCGTQLHWVDLDESRPLSLGVIVLSHEGTITQIEAGTPRFRTQDGITWGSSPMDVKKHYPGLKAYEAIGTTSEAVGGRNLIFWMDEKKGLGFVFAYSRTTRDWNVYKIVVFSPGGRFCPEANNPTPDTWKELAPYSLEAPDHRASLRNMGTSSPVKRDYRNVARKPVLIQKPRSDKATDKTRVKSRQRCHTNLQKGLTT